MMNLAQYLQSKNLTQAEFADAIGVNQATVSRLAGHPARTPSIEVAKRIADATDGAVPIHSWPRLAEIVAAAASWGR